MSDIIDVINRMGIEISLLKRRVDKIEELFQIGDSI